MDISSTQKAKVFEIKLNDKRKNTYSGNVSTFEGKDENNKSKFCTWHANFVGDAFDKAGALKDKDDIVLTRAKLDNYSNKETKVFYVNVTVFDFEKLPDRDTKDE